MSAYLSFSDYCKSKFGCKVYKLALAGGSTCPNRDGTVGVGGCAFCAEGSGDFAERGGDVADQIARAKKRIVNKLTDGKYIAYFQSFTATHGDISDMRQRFFAAVRDIDIAAVSVATRPDCLGDDVMRLLSELAEIKPLFIELGLQTVHDTTARAFNRGYATEVYFDAVGRLHVIGANVVTHVILGLPGESRDMMLETVRRVGEVTDGIKLQLLHVLDGTPLAVGYRRGDFDVLGMDEYIDILCDCIRALPPRVVVHRLTGDAPKRLLVAPEWSADKKRVLNAIRRAFAERGVRQGSAR